MSQRIPGCEANPFGAGFGRVPGRLQGGSKEVPGLLRRWLLSPFQQFSGFSMFHLLVQGCHSPCGCDTRDHQVETVFRLSFAIQKQLPSRGTMFLGRTVPLTLSDPIVNFESVEPLGKYPAH